MVRYLDPTYNDKRVWVSRLLAQFMFENAVIISVDESNFRSDILNKRSWRFAPKVSNIQEMLHGTQLEEEMNMPPLDFMMQPEVVTVE